MTQDWPLMIAYDSDRSDQLRTWVHGCHGDTRDFLDFLSSSDSGVRRIKCTQGYEQTPCWKMERQMERQKKRKSQRSRRRKTSETGPKSCCINRGHTWQIFQPAHNLFCSSAFLRWVSISCNQCDWISTSLEMYFLFIPNLARKKLDVNSLGFFIHRKTLAISHVIQLGSLFELIQMYNRRF